MIPSESASAGSNSGVGGARSTSPQIASSPGTTTNAIAIALRRADEPSGRQRDDATGWRHRVGAPSRRHGAASFERRREGLRIPALPGVVPLSIGQGLWTNGEEITTEIFV